MNEENLVSEDDINLLDEDVPMEEDQTEENTMFEYPVFDKDGTEIKNPDLTLGYLVEEKMDVYHPAIPEKYHYKVNHVTLTDGTDFYPEEDDPRINMPDNQVPNWTYVAPEPESIVEQYVDEEGQIKDRVTTLPVPTVKNASVSYVIDSKGISAWTERKTILRYKLYTEKELANNQFLSEAPTRLNETEQSINDITEVVADLAGSDIEERVDNTETRLTENENTVDELLLAVADILGGTEE